LFKILAKIKIYASYLSFEDHKPFLKILQVPFQKFSLCFKNLQGDLGA